MTRATDSLPLQGACLVAAPLQGEQREDGVYRADEEVDFRSPMMILTDTL